MKTRKIILSTSGFTIIELIFSLIILIFSVLTISSVSKMITDFSSRINSKQKLTQIKSEMINSISQTRTWAYIVRNADKDHPTLPGVKINSDLLCLKNKTNCSVGTYDLTLLDANGALITDPHIATKGFDNNGVACSSYGIDPKCTFRFALSWTVICAEGITACTNPQVKVKITASSSNELYANTKTLSPFELLVDIAKGSTPVVKKAVLITNSSHYYPSETAVMFDPAPYIFSEGQGNYTVSLTGTTSSTGGALAIAGNIITYTPKNSYYGFDQFQYKVTDTNSGISTIASAWVWVMTPYTWTGSEADPNTSTTKNFCGKVKNGTCDKATFPANDKHYVFNNNCKNCTILLNTDAQTIELTKEFTGTVRQILNVSLNKTYLSSWQKFPTFSQKGGIFEGQSNIFTVEMSGSWTVNDWSFSLSGGAFNAPSTLRVVGPFEIQPTATFNHKNGLVNLFQMYLSSTYVQAPDVHFFNLQFDNRPLS